MLDRAPLLCSREARIAECVRGAAATIHGRRAEGRWRGVLDGRGDFCGGGDGDGELRRAGAGAHEAVEWGDIDSVVDCARVLAETARRYCGA